MKYTFIIVLAAFVITDNTSQGEEFFFKKRCPHTNCGQCPNPLVAHDNRTFIYLENRLNSTPAQIQTNPHNDPTVVKKNYCCLCKLPVCVCCKFDNPEAWYVKTFLRGNTPLKPAIYSIKRKNQTEKDFIRKQIKSEAKAKDTRESFIRKLSPRKKRMEHGNKWLFGCPPLINLSKKQARQNILKNFFSVQSDCSQCKLHSPDDKSEVLLKCVKCGPIYFNKTKEKVNFSKLLYKRKNQLRIRAKYVQVNYN